MNTILIDLVVILVVSGLLEIIYLITPQFFFFGALLVVLAFVVVGKLDRIEQALSEERRDGAMAFRKRLVFIVPLTIILVAIQTYYIFDLFRDGNLDKKLVIDKPVVTNKK